MSFSAKRFAYCTRPSRSSQSAVCRIAEPRLVAAFGTVSRFRPNALRGRALAGLPPAREGFFTASTHLAGDEAS
jgi:hypothetical protein